MFQAIDTSPKNTEEPVMVLYENDANATENANLADQNANPEDQNANPEDQNANPEDQNSNPEDQNANPEDQNANPEDQNLSPEDQNVNSQEDLEEDDSVPSGSSPSEVSLAQSTTTQVGGIEENYDDEPDETIAERLWGLTEMFPDPVRDYAAKVTKFTTEAAQKLFSVSCRVIWVIASSSVILFAPAILEVERAKIRESQISQQKNVLLGPAVAMATNPMNSRGAMEFKKAS